MNINDAINVLNKQIPNPEEGLPKELFYYISKTTPLVNVDLLIKDENGRILLSWRDDEYAGKGWHLPGGIVRFRETLDSRIQKVAETELGASIDFDPKPLAITQIINKKVPVRGHFLSILFKCSIPSSYEPNNKALKNTDPGYLKWHETCPDDLLELQDVYREFI